jgi:hypothetical protein
MTNSTQPQDEPTEAQRLAAAETLRRVMAALPAQRSKGDARIRRAAQAAADALDAGRDHLAAVEDTYRAED